VLRVLAFYLAALVLGLGLFAVQMLASGGDGGHHGAPALDADGDFGADALALGAAAQGEPGALPGAPHGAEAGGASWASIFTSLRFYMFAAIGLGMVGAPGTLFDPSTPRLTFGVALATGFGVGMLAALAFRRLGHETLSSGATDTEMVGQIGRVLVACEKGRKGKVRLTVRGQTIDRVATTDELRLEPAAVVIVESVHDQGVHVCAAPAELLPD
jgi:membrane protein implicated in regulation of membrane protease activity